MGKHEIAKQSAVTQDKALRLAVSTFGILLSIIIIAGAILTNTKVSADNPAHANASVNVSAACTLSGGATYVDNIPNNSSKTFGPGTLRATCNDPDGYSIYAIGYSNNTYGNTSMVSTTDSTSSTNIPTNTTGSNSWWAMQLSATGATIQNNFDSLHVIPDTYTKVATKTSVSAGTTGESTVNSNYTVNISSTQAAGTYNGKVKYTLVHPNTAPAPSTLWQTIANMSKGKQTLADLQTEIATPTAESPISSNSGVYEYNASVFGESSDASNAFPIYYYRGVLDTFSGLGTYGSDGQADAYPNYIKLSNNTCWRIVRTTGSGGVKMIYNGTYANNTCINSGTAAQLTTSPFNNRSTTVAGTTYTGLEYHNMHAVGYTYSDVAVGTTSATSLSTLFGSSGNDTTTNTNDSIIKQYLESGWYNGNMTSYTSMLEPNAGYCNDRTTYKSGSYAKTDQKDESTKVIPSGAFFMSVYYYGAYTRDRNAAQNPSLTCPRGVVDLYSTTTVSGGNGQLNYPVALLTADEVTLAGSGYSGATGSVYHANSFLYSGYYGGFWLLSPFNRTTDGVASEFTLNANGRLGSYGVNSVSGVRPVISLTPGTTITGGNGTATDPWTVE